MTDKPIHLETRLNEGARLYSPSAGRNRQVIGDCLREKLPENAKVLEIASGTGEHGAYVCGLRNDVIWQPSDPDAASRASQNAWAADHPEQILPSLELNTMQKQWWQGIEAVTAIYCANMIHIAPWEAALGLAKGATALLSDGGMMFLYGPFKEGQDTADSNLEFDVNLKKRDARWGVRDLQSVKHIFADAGLNFVTRIVMPKENRMLIFSK